MALIEHEVPESDIIRLLQLRDYELEIVEVPIGDDSPSSGKRIEQLKMPEGTRLISVAREGRSTIATDSTKLVPGDRVLAILQTDREDELRRVLLRH
jgi:trk system potassium uptake protein TrkA